MRVTAAPLGLLTFTNDLSRKHVKDINFILIPFFRGYAYFFGNLYASGAKLRAVNQCFDFVANAFGSYCVHGVCFLLFGKYIVATLLHTTI
jgi:hypothetical protein